MNLKKGKSKIQQFRGTEFQQANEELEEYGTRLCVRIDGVPTVDNNTSDEVLDKVKSLIEQISYDISDGVSNRFHRTGKRYNKKEKNKCTL